MKNAFSAVALCALALPGALAPMPAHAAPSYDNCTGFLEDISGPIIDYKPIPSSGTWCMRSNHTVAVSGFGISYVSLGDSATVTLDCKGFRIENTQHTAVGIYTGGGRVVVRNCDLRGFGTAIEGAGMAPRSFLAEDNVFVNNRTAISIQSPGALLRRNRIFDSGVVAVVVYGAAQVEENLIDGVVSAGTTATGIQLNDASGTWVRGNVVRNVHMADGIESGTAVGIRSITQSGSPGATVRIEDNVLVGNESAGQVAFSCTVPGTRYADNVVAGFETTTVGCTDAGDNDVTP